MANTAQPRRELHVERLTLPRTHMGGDCGTDLSRTRLRVSGAQAFMHCHHNIARGVKSWL